MLESCFVPTLYLFFCLIKRFGTGSVRYVLTWRAVQFQLELRIRIHTDPNPAFPKFLIQILRFRLHIFKKKKITLSFFVSLILPYFQLMFFYITGAIIFYKDALQSHLSSGWINFLKMTCTISISWIVPKFKKKLRKHKQISLTFFKFNGRNFDRSPRNTNASYHNQTNKKSKCL